jgi:hypothetical protein
VRFLNGAEIEVRNDPIRGTPRLTIQSERTWLGVHFARAFPFSDPSGYVAAFDDQGKEIAMITDLSDLDQESREIVDQDLARRYFTPTIQRVCALKQDATLWLFDVETSRGPCEFYVRHWRDNAYELSPGRWMITSVDGVRFEIPDWGALDERSKVLLEQLN